MRKPTKFTEHLKQVFLENYALNGRVCQSCVKAGIHRDTVQKHRKEFPEFEKRCQLAYQTYCEAIEAEIERRAMQGCLKPVFQRGILVAHIREYSDGLLLAHAKKHIPGYREKHSVDLNHVIGALVVPGMAKDSHEWERGDNSDEKKG